MYIYECVYFRGARVCVCVHACAFAYICVNGYNSSIRRLEKQKIVTCLEYLSFFIFFFFYFFFLPLRTFMQVLVCVYLCV